MPIKPTEIRDGIKNIHYIISLIDEILYTKDFKGTNTINIIIQDELKNISLKDDLILEIQKIYQEVGWKAVYIKYVTAYNISPIADMFSPNPQNKLALVFEK
ncbi:MAG: hypothetical protein RSE41_00285 [Clostridia bacterium]